jgi:hypothetical protein
MVVGFITTYAFSASPLTLWVQTLLRSVLDTTLCDKVCQWLVTGLWFSQGTLVSSTNKTDCHNVTEILLKHHNPNPNPVQWYISYCGMHLFFQLLMLILWRHITEKTGHIILTNQYVSGTHHREDRTCYSD